VPAQTALPQPPPTADAVAAHRGRGLAFLCLASAGVGLAMTLQLALNSNFVADDMRLSGVQQGLLEACRESCGILALGVLAVLASLAEPLIGALVLVLVGTGLGSYAYVPTYAWLIAASLVWSQGLHVWMPLPNSMGMALAEPGRVGHRLGQIQAAGAAGSAAGLIIAIVLHVEGVAIRPLYLVAGAAALLGAAACLGIPRAIKGERPRIVLRKRYGLFYLLSFLEGWRKQIFVGFAGFLLVKKYETPLTTMLWMWVAIQVVGWFASPAVGRLIDRVGERRVLVFYYSSLTVFFLCYALIPYRELLYAVFVIDSAFFVFAMALTTYVSRIAPPESTRPPSAPAWPATTSPP
jgi:MFS family permease